MIRVMHVITGLGVGGAETMLCKLLSRTNRDAFDSQVISLSGGGATGDKIRALGVPVATLGMRPGLPHPARLARLAGTLRAARPDVIQTWMYHADLLGGLAARAATPRVPVIWNIRHTDLDPRKNKRSTLWTAAACAWLSRRLPVRIVSCSETARAVHVQRGYAADKMLVIPNGFDLSAFGPDPDARLSVRRELGIPPDTLLIGLVGRFHLQKDHANFVRAAATLRAAPHSLEDHVHFLLCGDGVNGQNRELAGWIEAAGLDAHFHLLGRRSDVARLTAALDIATSSSLGEGFPNAIGEAMACAVPCAVTDVGDSALLVGDTGRIVRARSPAALAGAWQELIALGADARSHLGQAARRRVAERFDLGAITARYEALYRAVATNLKERERTRFWPRGTASTSPARRETRR